jgi:hypothetical protein
LITLFTFVVQIFLLKEKYKKLKMKKIILLICYVAFLLNANAQAPLNDEPCGAIDLAVLPGESIFADCVPTTVYNYTNATLTPAVPNPTCLSLNYANIRDVWYKFTVPASGSFIVNTLPANVSVDFTMAIYTAASCSGVLTEIGCNDDFNGLYPRILGTATVSQTVYIRIFRYTGTAAYSFGDFKMCVMENNVNNNPIIDNTKKVGIGISTPFAKLDVAGSGIFRDTVIFAKTIDLRSGFKIKSGAGNGNILTSDAEGNATWGYLPNSAIAWAVNGVNIYNYYSGNVGIGTSTPTSKLNVNGQVTIDQKNFGGYGGLLLKGNIPGSNYPNIAFTIKNNAATPIDEVAAMIQGDLQNNTVGNESIDLTFLTSQTGLGGLSEKFRIKANGNIGIGTGSPGFPLNFASILGDKISLYGNAGNHYGFGIQGGTLQIHAGVSTDDIAFGTGSSNSFNERFRFKGNGSMTVNGNIGIAGQVLTTNGNGTPVSWSNNSNTQQYNSAIEKRNTQQYMSSGTPVEIVEFGQTLVLSKPSLVICNYNIFALASYCFTCGATSASVDLKINGTSYIYNAQDVNNSSTATFNGYRAIKLPAGTHNISVFINKISGGGDFVLIPANATDGFGYLNIQVIPQ